MTDQELQNLQMYIGKRSQNQTDKQVTAHIKKIDNQTPLTDEEWHKLIYPCCNCGYVEILKFILAHLTSLKDVKKYMIHTVYGRNESLDEQRIEILKELLQYVTEHKSDCLNETMIDAGWFGETKIVKFLVENGADINYKDENALGLLECAERAEKQFDDCSLKEYLLKLHG